MLLKMLPRVLAALALLLGEMGPVEAQSTQAGSANRSVAEDTTEENFPTNSATSPSNHTACNTCSGTRTVTCGVCGGSGFFPSACYACGGSGEIRCPSCQETTETASVGNADFDQEWSDLLGDLPQSVSDEPRSWFARVGFWLGLTGVVSGCTLACMGVAHFKEWRRRQQSQQEPPNEPQPASSLPTRYYYKTLGVPRDASADEIRKAYKELMRENHPDLNPNDKAAVEKFKQIQEAYAVLRDPEKRVQYDRYG